MATTPIEFMIRTSDISADELYIAPNLPYPVLVDYDLVFIAISEAEANNPALKMAHTLLKQWRLPYANNPDEIPFLARDRACELMDTVPGIDMPQNIILDREQFKDMANLQQQLSEYLVEAQFPIIARPFDSHAGQGLSKLSSYQDIDRYLHSHKDKKFLSHPSQITEVQMGYLENTELFLLAASHSFVTWPFLKTGLFITSMQA